MARTSARQRSRRPWVSAAVTPLVQLVRRRLLPSDGFVLTELIALALALGYLSTLSPAWVPTTALILVLLIGGFSLRMRSLVRLDVVIAAVVLVEAVLRTTDPVAPGEIAVLAGTAVIGLVMARMRTRLGVVGSRGESMLVDLRDRLSAQGRMPELPSEWQSEVVLR